MPFSMRLTFLVGVMLASVIAEPAIPPTAPVGPKKLAVKPLMLPRNDPDPKMTHKPVVLDPEAPVPQKPLGWKPPAAPPVQVDMDKAVVPKVVKSDADLAQEDMEKRFTSRPIVIDPKAPIPANAAVKLCPGCGVDDSATKSSGEKIEAETTHDDVVSAISIDDTVQDDDLNADLTSRLNELMQKMNMTKAEKKTEQESKNAQSLEALTKKLKEKAPLSQMEANLVKQFQAQFELLDEKKKEMKTEEQELKNETLTLKKESVKAKVAEKKLVEKAVGEQADRKQEKQEVKEQMKKITEKAATIAEKTKKIEQEAVNAMANASGAVAAIAGGVNVTATQAAATEGLRSVAAAAEADELKAQKRELKKQVEKSGNSTGLVAAIKTVEGKEQNATKQAVESLGEAAKANPTPENEKKLVEALTKTIAKTADKVEKKVLKIDTKLEKVEAKLPDSSPVKAAVEKKVAAKLTKLDEKANSELSAVASAAQALPAAAQQKIKKAVKMVKKEVDMATKPLPQVANATEKKAVLKKGEAAAKVLKALAKAMPKVAVKVETAIKAPTPAVATDAAVSAAAPAMATAPKTMPKVPAVSASKVSDDINEIKDSMAPATEKIPALVASPESEAEMAAAGAKINMYLQHAGRLVTGVKLPPTPTVDFSPKLRSALAKADEALAKLDALFYDGSKKLKAIALRRAKLGEQLTDLGAAMPQPDLGAQTATCCAPHPAPPVLSDLPVFHPAPPVPQFKTPDYKQMNVPTHYIHHVVHVTHTHQYVLPTLPMSQMSTIHQATQVFHVDPAAIRSSPVLVSADDKCAGCNKAPSTTTMVNNN